MVKRRLEEEEMKEVTISVTISEDDLFNLKIAQSSLSDISNSGIIDHIITLAEDKFKLPPKEITVFQEQLLKGLLKLNDVPIEVFNFEYHTEIAELEKLGIISYMDKNGMKLIHLNFDSDKYKSTMFLDEIYIEFKKQYNIK